MKAVRKPWGWLELWLVWILVTGATWCVGLAIALVISQGASAALPENARLALGGVVVGALIGIVQWQILRPGIRGSGSWLLATALGWSAGLVITTYASRLTTLASGAVLGGLVFGLAQWLVLRPASRDRAEWMLGTVAGWTAAFTLGAALSGDLRLDALGGGVVDVSMTGALGLVVMGLVAAVALIWLFPAGRQDRTAYVRWWP